VTPVKLEHGYLTTLALAFLGHSSGALVHRLCTQHSLLAHCASVAHCALDGHGPVARLAFAARLAVFELDAVPMAVCLTVPVSTHRYFRFRFRRTAANRFGRVAPRPYENAIGITDIARLCDADECAAKRGAR
jgi:hypothetical protein